MEAWKRRVPAAGRTLPKKTGKNPLESLYGAEWPQADDADSAVPRSGFYDSPLNSALDVTFDDPEQVETGAPEATVSISPSTSDPQTASREQPSAAGTKPDPRNADQTRDLLEEYKANFREFNDDAAQIDQQLMGELAKAKAIYQTGGDRVNSQEMWDKIIQGAGHLLAGVIGMNTGLNLGGLQFNQTDWEAKRNRLLREMDQTNREAYQLMDNRQRELANRRQEVMKQYTIERDDLDRAYQSQRDLAAAEEREKDRTQRMMLATQKALAKGNYSQLDKEEYNRLLGNFDQAMTMFQKDDSSTNREALQTAATLANEKAKAMGLPMKFPENFGEDTSAWWSLGGYGYKDAAAELREFTKQPTGQPATPGGYIRLSNGTLVKKKAP